MQTKESENDTSFLTKPKIAFVISSLTPGGAERVVTTLANALVEDYQVVIITLYSKHSFYTIDERVKVIACKTEYKTNSNILKSLTNNFQLIGCIYKILKKENVALAIGFMTTTNIYTIIACKLLNIPSIVSERTHPEYSSLTNFWSKIRRQVYPLCNKLIVQTAVIKSYFETILEPDKISIIRNPLSNTMLNHKSSSIDKKPIILNVGRLSPVKNQALLIEAFCELETGNWKLIIAGEGRLRNKLEQLIKNHKAEKNIELLGNIDHVHDYYNCASIFAFTSIYEGFPNTLTEAMAFGLPCISTDCPSGPSEIIDSGKNGFLIPVGNKELLKKHLKILIENPELRNKLGLAAEKSTESYNIQVIKLQWQNIINNALNV